MHPVPSPVFAFTELYLHTVVHVLAFNQRTMSGRADDRQTHQLLPFVVDGRERICESQDEEPPHPHHSSHSLTQLAAMFGQDETDGDSILLRPSSGIIRSSK